MKNKDIIPFSRYRSDPEVAKYQGWDVPYTIEQAAKFVHKMKAKTPGEPGQWYQIAIELTSSNKMIGDCAFHRFARDLAQAEIGLMLARDYQGLRLRSRLTALCLKNLKKREGLC